MAGGHEGMSSVLGDSVRTVVGDRVDSVVSQLQSLPIRRLSMAHTGDLARNLNKDVILKQWRVMLCNVLTS